MLELVVTENLYKNHKNPEGELTNWRAALVNAKMLTQVAGSLDFNSFLLLSRGEQKELGKARQYILANTFESFVGSLYLDQGYLVCQQFIKRHLLKELPKILETQSFKDAKSLFQEQAQEESGVTPTYKVLEESGPDHARHFVVGVFLKEALVAQGSGFSKQEAQEKAARAALEIKK